MYLLAMATHQSSEGQEKWAVCIHLVGVADNPKAGKNWVY
jgi:hypothetical protein